MGLKGPLDESLYGSDSVDRLMLIVSCANDGSLRPFQTLEDSICFCCLATVWVEATRVGPIMSTSLCL